MSNKRIPILSYLGDVITGKAKVGQTLNKVLPFRKSREAIGEVIKGAKDLVPTIQAKDASVVRDAEKMKILVNDLPKDYAELNMLFKKSPDLLINKLYEIRDILDDGRLNGSAEGLTPDAKYKLRLATSGILLLSVIYEIAAYFMGWPHLPLSQILELINQ